MDSSIAKKKPPQDIFMDADIEDDKPVVERSTKIIVFHGNKYTGTSIVIQFQLKLSAFFFKPCGK